MNAFVHEARKAGVDIFRVFDSLNYVDNIKFGLDAVHAANGVAEGTICYTGDIMDPNRFCFLFLVYLQTIQQSLTDSTNGDARRIEQELF